MYLNTLKGVYIDIWRKVQKGALHTENFQQRKPTWMGKEWCKTAYGKSPYWIIKIFLTFRRKAAEHHHILAINLIKKQKIPPLLSFRSIQNAPYSHKLHIISIRHTVLFLEGSLLTPCLPKWFYSFSISFDIAEGIVSLNAWSREFYGERDLWWYT